MIRSFYIDNFKSLVEFHLPPEPHQMGRFTCLVGLNGAGKSTVLQAFDFLGHLASGKVESWLKHREWEKADLTSRFHKKQLISFRLVFEFKPLGIVEWKGAFNTSLLRCTSETIRVDGDVVLKIAEHQLQVAGRDQGEKLQYPLQGLTFEGSTLSILNVNNLHAGINVVKEFIEGLKSLDMLSPQLMRRRAKEGQDIGYGGERLSAYLHSLDKPARERLLKSLKDFYPQVTAWFTKALRSGWKDLRVVEEYLDVNGNVLETGARQINDGLLRVLAVLAQVEPLRGVPLLTQIIGDLDAKSPTGLVLFDEIENGINPEIVEQLVKHLLSADQQVMVTTHSPLILNYLPDEVAQEAVILLYRNTAGHTKAVRLFDLPSAKKRLSLLGPGEVFVDVDLRSLPAEAMDATQVVTR